MAQEQEGAVGALLNEYMNTATDGTADKRRAFAEEKLIQNAETVGPLLCDRDGLKRLCGSCSFIFEFALPLYIYV